MLITKGIVEFRSDSKTKELDGKGGYEIHLTKDLVLNCWTTKDGMCLASMANTAANAMQIGTGKPANNNAKIIRRKLKDGTWDVYIRSGKFPIGLEEEIFVPYSNSYSM